MIFMTKLERLQARLDSYLDAEEKILRGQSYKIGDRELTRADLSKVQSMIDDLEFQIATLDGSRSAVRRVVFTD